MDDDLDNLHDLVRGILDGNTAPEESPAVEQDEPAEAEQSVEETPVDEAPMPAEVATDEPASVPEMPDPESAQFDPVDVPEPETEEADAPAIAETPVEPPYMPSVGETTPEPQSRAEAPQNAQEKPQRADVDEADVEPPFMPEMPDPPTNRPSSVPQSQATSEEVPTTRNAGAGGSFSAEVKHDVRVTHEMGQDAAQLIASQLGEKFEEMNLTIGQQMRDYVDQQIALLDRGAFG